MTKQNLKRILSLLMVAILCFGLTACSNSSSEESEWSVWEDVSYVTVSNDKDSDNISDLHEQISPIPRVENTDIKKSLFARMGQRDSFFADLCPHSYWYRS